VPALGAVGAVARVALDAAVPRTWMVDTARLAAGGRGRAALLNVVLNVALGLAALGVGWSLGSGL
jgi:fluoride ion exporter CrcB/FEX